MSWLSELIRHVTTTEAVDFVISPALGAGTATAVTTPLVSGQAYVTVRIASLRLPNTRQKIFDRVYGLVHAYGQLSSPRGADLQFAAATMPSQLAGVDPKNLQNVLSINKAVMGPTPWSGGDLQLQLGLFSVVSENLAGPFLETLTALTDTVGVAFAGAAKPYVDLVKFGVEKFTDASGSVKLEIGLDQTLPNPATGYFALVAARKDALAGKKFSYDPADFKLLVDGVAYTDKPYLIFAIEASQQRPDWGNIPDIKQSYAALIAAIEKGDRNTAQDSLTVFKRLTTISPDLIDADGERLIAKVDALFNKVFAAAGNSAEAVAVLPKFHQLDLYDA